MIEPDFPVLLPIFCERRNSKIIVGVSTMSTHTKISEYYKTKNILMASASFGLLRKELIENLGVRRAKGFLLRYGWHLGETNADEIMKVTNNFQELIENAAILHLKTGQISDVTSERT